MKFLFKILKNQNVTDGQMDGWMDGLTDGQCENSISPQTHSLWGGIIRGNHYQNRFQ